MYWGIASRKQGRIERSNEFHIRSPISLQIYIHHISYILYIGLYSYNIGLYSYNGLYRSIGAIPSSELQVETPFALRSKLRCLMRAPLLSRLSQSPALFERSTLPGAGGGKQSRSSASRTARNTCSEAGDSSVSGRNPLKTKGPSRRFVAKLREGGGLWQA